MMAGKDERYDDKSFDQQVHDAYERIELCDEAQDRMLANLLAAQKDAAREQMVTSREEVPKIAVEQSKHGKVVRMRWLPVAAAAAVAAVLVVVGVAGIGAKSGTNMSTSEERMATDAAPVAEYAQEGAAASKDESSAMATESDAAEMAEAAAPDDRIHSLAALFPRIVLADGKTLTTLSDGAPMEQVDAGEVGELVGEATASDDASSGEVGPVSCKVYQIKQDAGAYAVQYDGEDSYWRCMPLE